MAQDQQQIIQEFLTQQAPALGLSQEALAAWRVSSEHTSSSSGVHYVYLQQVHQGLPIINGTASIALHQGKVAHLGHQLANYTAFPIPTSTPNLSPEQAILQAAQFLQLSTNHPLSLLYHKSPQHYTYPPAGISTRNIPVKLVYYAQDKGQLHLAWDLSIQPLDAQHWWSIKIDAHTGALLEKADWTSHCQFPSCNNNYSSPSLAHKPIPTYTANSPQYLVFPLPIESPHHGSRTLVTNPADSLASPFGWHDVDGLAGAEYTITQGNNVHAYEDRASLNTPGFSPDGGNSLSFTAPYNPNSPPVAYQAASITNLFYTINTLHDIAYHYGFDEASGNFQSNNYGRGGTGGDALEAEALDGGGVNNALFSTPVEGTNPRLQLYTWGTGATPAGNFLKINSPLAIAQGYWTADAEFGPGLPNSPLTGDLLLLNDHSGNHDACDSVTNAAALAGHIAVIDRGSCSSTEKVLAAQAAGAIAVIIINDVAGTPVTLTGFHPAISIPAVMIAQADGNSIKTALAAGPVNGSLQGSGLPHPIRGTELDNGIVVHEYGHGISSRLIGGASNVNCLLNAEQAGEGWSDWLALMMTLKAGDTGQQPKTIGTYVAGHAPTGSGIRPAPYSTDFNSNNYTYGATNQAAFPPPHGTGFIFATVLWDLTWALVNYHGGILDLDWYQGTAGNNKALQLVMESFKIMPCSPGMLDARDAILQADQFLYNGQHECVIWETFARRGFGFSASQGSAFSRVDQVEAFDLPPACLLNTPVSISNISIQLAPNPTQQQSQLLFQPALQEPLQVQLFSLTGQLLQQYNVPIGSTQYILSLQQLPPALYHLQLKNSTIYQTLKLVVY